MYGEYKLVVVHDYNYTKMEKMVNLFCEQGYQPLGGIVMSKDTLIQTLYKTITMDDGD